MIPLISGPVTLMSAGPLLTVDLMTVVAVGLAAVAVAVVVLVDRFRRRVPRGTRLVIAPPAAGKRSAA